MSKVLKLIIAGAVLAVVAFVAIYSVFFSSDSPDEFEPTAVEESRSTTTIGDGVEETWTAASGSEAGYRVREKLANLPAQSDAVGRTADVTGTFVLRGAQVTKADFEVDLTTLESDEDRRDNRVRSTLQVEQFPTATFTLSTPIEVTSASSTLSVSATGDLTVKGVTKEVTIPITATRIDDQLELVGKVTFPMADFEIDPPSIGGFVTVEDDATLEFKILMEKSA